jgi:hypothetical protein
MNNKSVAGEPQWPSAIVAVALVALVAIVTVAAIQADQSKLPFNTVWTALGPIVGIITGAMATYFYNKATAPLQQLHLQRLFEEQEHLKKEKSAAAEAARKAFDLLTAADQERVQRENPSLTPIFSRVP